MPLCRPTGTLKKNKFNSLACSRNGAQYLSSIITYFIYSCALFSCIKESLLANSFPSLLATFQPCNPCISYMCQLILEILLLYILELLVTLFTQKEIMFSLNVYDFLWKYKAWTKILTKNICHTKSRFQSRMTKTLSNGKSQIL